MIKNLIDILPIRYMHKKMSNFIRHQRNTNYNHSKALLYQIYILEQMFKIYKIQIIWGLSNKVEKSELYIASENVNDTDNLEGVWIFFFLVKYKYHTVQHLHSQETIKNK